MSNLVRIAQIVGKMNGGGVETFLMNYFRHIDRNNVVFDFFIDEDSSVIPREEIEDLGGRVIIVPSYSKIFEYRKHLGKYFSNLDYRIVHSHLNSLSLFPLQVAKASQVPVRIAHSHSTSGGNAEKVHRRMFKSFLKRFSNIYPTHRFACSRHAGNWLFGHSRPFEVIPDAIDIPSFRFNESSRQRIRSEFGIPENTRLLGTVGRLCEQKNQSFLIDIFKKLIMLDSNYMLMIVGQGELKEKLKTKALSMGIKDKVVFTNYRDDIADIYSAFDQFALPSLYEGLGIVVIEAQASGLMCILSDNVPKEAVLSDSFKFLSLNESADKWAHEIESAYKPDRTFKINTIIETSFYDIETASKALCERYLQLYNSVAES